MSNEPCQIARAAMFAPPGYEESTLLRPFTQCCRLQISCLSAKEPEARMSHAAPDAVAVVAVTRLSGSRGTAETERIGVGRQRVDDELNMVVERNAQAFDARIDILALDLRRKALVLELLLHARRGKRSNPVGAYE